MHPIRDAEGGGLRLQSRLQAARAKDHQVEAPARGAGGESVDQEVVRLLVLQPTGGHDIAAALGPRQGLAGHLLDAIDVDRVVDHPKPGVGDTKVALEPARHLVGIGQDAIGGAVAMAHGGLHRPAAERIVHLVVDHHVGVVAFARDPARRPGPQAEAAGVGDDVHPLQEADHHVGAEAAHHRRHIGRREKASQDQPVGLVEAGVLALVAHPVPADRGDVHSCGIHVGQIGARPLQKAKADIHQAAVASVDQVRRNALGAPAVHRGRQEHDARARLVAESLVCPAVRHGRLLTAVRRPSQLRRPRLQPAGERLAEVHAAGGVSGVHGGGGGRHGQGPPAAVGPGHDLRGRSGRPRCRKGGDGQHRLGSPCAGGRLHTLRRQRPVRLFAP